MSTEKKEPFIYWEVHGYKELESGERQETNIITTNIRYARDIALTLLGDACTSVSFDMVESFERLCL